MSYCRFSCDDFRSDVYVYGNTDGGYTIHVAAQRTVFAEPLPPQAPEGDLDAAADRMVKVMEIAARSTAEPLASALAGAAFHDASANDCAERLEGLRAAGLHVPQHAIVQLRKDARTDLLEARWYDDDEVDGADEVRCPIDPPEVAQEIVHLMTDKLAFYEWCERTRGRIPGRPPLEGLVAVSVMTEEYGIANDTALRFPRHRAPLELDITRDPIFLFMEKRRLYSPACPYEYDSDTEAFLDDEGDPIEDHQLREEGYLIECWSTVTVFLTRADGEHYGNTRGYNYPHGWRVYCVAAEGDLKHVLADVTEGGRYV